MACQSGRQCICAARRQCSLHMSCVQSIAVEPAGAGYVARKLICRSTYQGDHGCCDVNHRCVKQRGLKAQHALHSDRLMGPGVHTSCSCDVALGIADLERHVD